MAPDCVRHQGIDVDDLINMLKSIGVIIKEVRDE
jgi:hypothetical protein